MRLTFAACYMPRIGCQSQQNSPRCRCSTAKVFSKRKLNILRVLFDYDLKNLELQEQLTNNN